MPTPIRRRAAVLALAAFASAGAFAVDLSQLRAPGVDTRTAGSRLLVVPPDMELFSISAGGVPEPRADWTETAQRNFTQALEGRRALLGDRLVRMTPAELDEYGEIAALHRAVADAVYQHHVRSGMKLPTKNGELRWSLGDAVRPLKERTGADYALFTWIRDSYTSSERKAAMVAMALLGAISLPGTQMGYASLVDLNTGRIVWFNDIDRMWGDLREPQPAADTLDALLEGFPPLPATDRSVALPLPAAHRPVAMPLPAAHRPVAMPLPATDRPGAVR